MGPMRFKRSAFVVLLVLVLAHLSAGSIDVINLGFDTFVFFLDGDRITISVSEARQGTDLNGDGDTLDTVFHVHDAATSTTVNVGLAIGGFVLDGNLVAFSVFEARQGTDLNGDGDTSDGVLHVHDAATSTTVNVGLAVSDDLAFLDGERMAFLVREARQGNTDLNGDGDTGDAVLHLHDAATSATVNVGLAALRQA